jgi:putative flippase GtrA
LLSKLKTLWNDDGRLQEVLRFLFVGGFCFVLEYTLLYTLTEFGGIMYLTSAAIAFTISLIVNYILCVTVVFHGARHQTPRQMILFITTSLMGLGINQVTMWFFVEITGLWYMFAKLIASGVVMFWNYVTKRLILTKKEPVESHEKASPLGEKVK